MKRDLITIPTAPAWELVDEALPLQKLTAADLTKMQGFPEWHYTTESPPCAHFSMPKTRRLA